MAAVMIASVETVPAPRRLVLGQDAFSRVEAALQSRLRELQSQREVAHSTEA